MRILVKRSIIATLAVYSYAILTSVVFADSIQSHSEESYAISASSGLSNLNSSEQCEPKSYLFECVEDSWLKGSLENLQTFQIWLGGYVQDTGEGIDSYFGSTDSFDLARGSRLDIMLPMVIHDSGLVELQVRTRAKIQLPKLKNRWHLLVSSQDSGLKETSNNDLTREVLDENSQASLGLQAILDATKDNEISLDFGFKFSDFIKPDPYIRVRKRSEWRPISGWNNRMINTLFWERVAGAGINSKVVLDNPFSPTYLFRSQTEATWWNDDRYYDMTQRLLLYQTINTHRVLTYQTWTRYDSFRGELENTHYGFNLNWRERAYKNWLYFEVQPGVEWSDENDFTRPDITMTFMLEMRFFKKHP